MKFRGTGVALVTPFKEGLEIDFDSLQKLIEYVSEGVEYLVVQGTTGESPTVSQDEKTEILKFVQKHNSKKLPIVFGIGGNNTQEIKEQLSSFDLSGVSAILSVSPYYNKPSQSALINHYESIADISPVPIILYNVPGRTGSNISASTTLNLSEHENIIGIKEASGDMEQIIEIALKKDDEFALISGDDMLTIPMISLGAIGVISVIANGFPNMFGNMVRSALNGEYKSIKSDYLKLNEINPLLYKESNPVGIKRVLQEMNICQAYCRPPLYAAGKSLSREIGRIVKKIRS